MGIIYLIIMFYILSILFVNNLYNYIYYYRAVDGVYYAEDK